MTRSPDRPHGSAALVVLSVYLVLWAMILGARGNLRLAAAHLVAVCLAWGIARFARDRSAIVAGLIALVGAPLLYVEVPMLIASIGSPMHDAAIEIWERRLFHGLPSYTLAAHLPYRALSETLHAGYLAYYLCIFVPPVLLLVRRRFSEFDATVLALTVTFLVCWTMYTFYPVEGPRYVRAPDGIPDGPMRRLAIALLAAGSSRGAAFPSSHMAVMTVQLIMAAVFQRTIAVVLAVVALLVGLGAVYGGFHYALDMIAGAALGAIVGYAVLIASRPRRFTSTDDNR